MRTGRGQKIKFMASSPTISWEIDGETVETVSDFIFLSEGTQTGALYQPREWDRERDEREVQEGGDKCIPMADSC